MKRSNVNGGAPLTKRDLGFLRLLGKEQYTGTSTLQLDQREKLRKIIDLFELIFHLIKSCYELFKKRKANAGRAAIDSLAAALRGEFPDVSIDFSKVSILQGTLAPHCGAMYHEENSDKLSFSWSQCTQCNSNQSDELMGMIYCPESREFWCELNLGITRADGFCTIDLPLEFRDREVHVWLAYRSADQRNHSNSTYMGKIFNQNTRITEDFKGHSTGFNTLIKALMVCMIVFQVMLLAVGAKGQGPDALTAHYGRSLKPGETEREVMKVCISQIGVREKHLNAGMEVEKYLRYVNLPKGNPWCAAFVCWVYGQANVPNPRSGWSPDLFPASRIVWQRTAGGKLQIPKSPTQRLQLTVPGPKPADVFGIYFPEKGRIAHVGFVEQWKEPWLISMEGNTNLPGNREGDGVYRKRRLIRSVNQVARYIN